LEIVTFSAGMPGRLWPVLFPGDGVGLVSLLWRRCRLSRADTGYQGMAGTEKGFREEADGNRMVAA